MRRSIHSLISTVHERARLYCIIYAVVRDALGNCGADFGRLVAGAYYVLSRRYVVEVFLVLLVA